MEPIFSYFIQSSLGIVLFYLAYLLLLKNETFYKTNRFFLLAGIILATLLPLFPITYTSTVQITDHSEFFSMAKPPADDAGFPAAKSKTSADLLWNISHFFWFAYVAGVLFFLLRLSWQMIKMARIIRKIPSVVIDGVKVIDLKTTMPFSYFHVVFIDIQEYSERELSNIIAHEKVHISERHWIDLLIIELLAVLFWINPVVWLYERAIKQNHEYLADRGVLLAGYNLGQYRALLINQLMGVKVAGFAHNLNFSLNKKRMEMMKKEKSSGVSKLKLLPALAIVALLMFAFAKKEYVKAPQHAAENNEQVINNSRKTVSVKGMTQDNNSNPLRGINIIVKGTTSGTVSNQNGDFSIDAPPDAELVFSFVGYEIQTHKVSTLSGKSAVITLTKDERRSTPADQLNEKMIKLDGTVKSEDGKLLTGASVVVKNTSTGTVVDQNGKFKLEVPDNSQIVISYVGYQTLHRGVTYGNSKDDAFKETYTLAKGVYNIKLPEITGDEIVELPPPPPPSESLKGTKGEVYTVVEEMPTYKKGGMYGLASELKKETTEVTKKTTDRGQAVVGFTVTAKGKVINSHIVKSSNSKVLDSSAVEIIQQLDNWKPGSQRGKEVSVDLSVPISFE